MSGETPTSSHTQRRTEAELNQQKANTLRQQAETLGLLVNVGFDRVKAVKAVTGYDLSVLTDD